MIRIQLDRCLLFVGERTLSRVIADCLMTGMGDCRRQAGGATTSKRLASARGSGTQKGRTHLLRFGMTESRSLLQVPITSLSQYKCTDYSVCYLETSTSKAQLGADVDASVRIDDRSAPATARPQCTAVADFS